MGCVCLGCSTLCVGKAQPWTIYLYSFSWNQLSSHFPLLTHIIKGQPGPHIAPAYVGSEEGSNRFGSYVRSISLYLYKRLFTHDLMVTRQQLYRCDRAPVQMFWFHVLYSRKFLKNSYVQQKVFHYLH
jgi:hypothetical protein